MDYASLVWSDTNQGAKLLKFSFSRVNEWEDNTPVPAENGAQSLAPLIVLLNLNVFLVASLK